MKKIVTTDITGSVGFPIKKGTLDHLQESYQEAIASLGKAITDNSAVVTILHGCVLSSSSPFIVSSGAVLYNGEVYQVDAINIAAGVGVLVGNIVTTNGTADPHLFTDGNSHNVHNVRKMVITLATSGTGTADYNNWIKHVKTVYVQIGAWDMDATASVVVTGFPISSDLSRVRSITAIIFSDGFLYATPLSADAKTAAQPYMEFPTASGIALYRTTGGIFDGFAYNDTSQNRGYIELKYTD